MLKEANWVNEKCAVNSIDFFTRQAWIHEIDSIYAVARDWILMFRFRYNTWNVKMLCILKCLVNPRFEDTIWNAWCFSLEFLVHLLVIGKDEVCWHNIKCWLSWFCLLAASPLLILYWWVRWIPQHHVIYLWLGWRKITFCLIENLLGLLHLHSIIAPVVAETVLILWRWWFRIEIASSWSSYRLVTSEELTSGSSRLLFDEFLQLFLVRLDKLLW